MSDPPKKKGKQLSDSNSQFGDGIIMGGTSKTAGSMWTVKERKNLLIALRAHGFMNMERLREAAPGRSDEHIQCFIKCVWKEARRAVIVNRKLRRAKQKPEDINNKSEVQENSIGPVDNWLEILTSHFKAMEEHKRIPIARAILMIALYEVHPDPSECNGIDFQSMYEFLFCMLCGFPTKDLNQPTARYVLQTLSNFAGLLKFRNNTNERKFIDSVKEIRCELKPGTDNAFEDLFKLSSREECAAEFLTIPGVNPLGVPPELLQKINGSLAEQLKKEAQPVIYICD